MTPMDTDAIFRACQLVLLVPAQVSEIEKLELPHRDQESHTARIFARVGVLQDGIGAQRVRARARTRAGVTDRRKIRWSRKRA